MLGFHEWGLNLPPQGERLMIAGPCSAETREQVLNTCLDIAARGKARLLRAGVWKPRTRPNSFEGVGEAALPWLAEVRQLTGLPVCIEVAAPEHVELALRYGVDVLWIGARTTVNPFAVQALADALRGCDVPVMVKNPVNPDLELWIGALERLHGAGLRRLAAIHRGFSVYNEARYRNAPLWELALELRRRLPQLPLLCDPSHIAGKREYLYEIAQQAIDLQMDGLMLETHCDPDRAWSDARQQVTPAQWASLLDRLVLRRPHPDTPYLEEQLEELRRQIDQTDMELLRMLGERMRIARLLSFISNSG